MGYAKRNTKRKVGVKIRGRKIGAEEPTDTQEIVEEPIDTEPEKKIDELEEDIPMTDDEVFTCENCGKEYKSKGGLARHVKTCDKEPEIEEKVEEKVEVKEEPVPKPKPKPKPAKVMPVENIVVQAMDEKLAKLSKNDPRYAKLKKRRDELAKKI